VDDLPRFEQSGIGIELEVMVDLEAISGEAGKAMLNALSRCVNRQVEEGQVGCIKALTVDLDGE